MYNCLIYGLYCPFTGDLYYVGKSTVGMLRPLEHMSRSHSDKINEWISQLKFLGYVPIIKILEECTIENIDAKEIEWINKSINTGCYLLNSSYNNVDNIFLQKEYFVDKECVYRIAKTIKDNRLSKNISANELSRAAKISRPTLSSIEHGNDKITLFNVNKILQALNLEIRISKKTKI